MDLHVLFSSCFLLTATPRVYFFYSQMVRCPTLGLCAVSIVPFVGFINTKYGQWLGKNAKSVQSALADAGLEADAVDLVNAHGTSTPVGDLCEVAAINAVFGSIDKSRFRLNSTKSMLGHSLGAAGALEAVACLQSIATGRVHPTINHDDPEDGVDFDVVANEAQDFRVKVALSNSFGFGGHNSSVLFGAFEG